MHSLIAKLVLIATLALSSAVHAREAVPVFNLENQSISSASGKALSLSDVKTAIIRAASNQRWNLTDAGSGKMTATLLVRGKHTVVVDITYSTDKFSVNYKDSIDMKYEVRDGTSYIHPSYNKWIQTLSNAIRIEVQKS